MQNQLKVMKHSREDGIIPIDRDRQRHIQRAKNCSPITGAQDKPVLNCFEELIRTITDPDSDE